MARLFLDTETTGIDRTARMVEVSVVDQDGNVVLDTLVNPGIPIPAGATAVHGISDHDVHDAPSHEQVRQDILELVCGREVVIFNAEYDAAVLGISCLTSIRCCMMRFSRLVDGWNQPRQATRWCNLKFAAQVSGYIWVGNPHRAMADTMACRHVWNWLEDNEDRFMELREQVFETARQQHMGMFMADPGPVPQAGW